MYVATKFKVSPALIFKLAYDNSEKRMKPALMRQEYEAYIIDGVMPTVVRDFCCDLLNGTVKIPREQKRIGAGK